ncbi:type VI secretion system protein ImpI [Luteibacter sp. Sphag1AF]|uniref:type VI secretion system-associated FHA domain protein TagH n=1 Tax=Luteibacter sp. Sphag1AF TaxID=2587031 RepID=UPI0016076CBF|nr:type VI secretion system-associated FHA domain protein TagH [Luteibacter sp. Sphag1AF]MBB3228142.1 type VI secretion system protein ImpI [Luteibacter sp. Sphag1AF]
MNSSIGPTLVLSVLGAHAADAAERPFVRVEGHDLTIGRAQQCDWVLHAQGVSRQHAVVRYLNGLYFLEDHSTNGMLVNGTPMRSGVPVSLNGGDRVQLDTFDIAVAIEDADAPTATTTSPSLIPGHPVCGASLDPLAWLPTAREATPVAEPSTHWNHTSPMADQFDAPPVNVTVAPPAGSVLPENWDCTPSLFRLPNEATSTADHALVRSETAVPVPLAETTTAVAPTGAPAAIESLFALVLEGVMDMLRARAELKNGFRLPVTLIQRRENNPLKFSPSGSEALARVLAAPNDAFLSGEAAIIDAMDDIRLHQVALLASVRAAFDEVIAQFDPARFDDKSRRSRFGFSTARGPWERYRAHFRGLAADPDERFRRLWGEEFVRAYEDQLARARRDDH